MKTNRPPLSPWRTRSWLRFAPDLALSVALVGVATWFIRETARMKPTPRVGEVVMDTAPALVSHADRVFCVRWFGPNAPEASSAGWAERNPPAVANCALQLERTELWLEALNQALPQWVARDPAAAASWLAHQDLAADFDLGSMVLATQPELLRQWPAVAARWAASIVEPALRANALRTVAIEWACVDAVGLSDFIAFTPELAESDRETLREGLNVSPGA